MVTDRAFIFHMCIPCGKTFSSIYRSRSSVRVRVKYPLVCRKLTNSKRFIPGQLTYTVQADLGRCYLKGLADNKIKCDSKIEICLWQDRKPC